MQPKYPLYVISKGRPDCCLSAINLLKHKVNFKLVVEPQDLDAYRNCMPDADYLVTPFSNLGERSIPVRNYIWNHSNNLNAKRHWCIDDNIRVWRKFDGESRIQINPGLGLRLIENHCDRWINVGIYGPYYTFFAIPRSVKIPYRKNIHVYSCMCIKNDLPFRWRGPWNEDVDLCLQSLANKHCTIGTYFITSDKMATMTMKGGNSDAYQNLDSRAYGSRTLQQRWPGIVELKNKYGRPHFHIKNNWRMFKDIPLVKDPDYEPESLKLKQVSVS